ncbi:DNA cytosine methyltransferase [Streptomyces malaysiense]|uniref:DNA (cytosine-5-)-methyltransferase n=1 Tax=Streptomyces malaysiense TaxID=1428626 RepID=A0A1J4Q7G0_9ACTN|nr:DNA cytosine methyltransferase [Streptomyces malaysiense]OIK28071.1 DNA (cytosine-5-)-methyltransferase [Streptomyces malaysiense]
MQRTSVELFAGGGGLVQASTNTGFRHLLLNEFAKRACETLESNRFEAFPADVDSDVLAKWLDQIDEQRAEGLEAGGTIERPLYPPLVTGDVRGLDMRFLRDRDVDLLAGGPPCQPFSLGGIAKGDEDERNMFPEMFRAVREIRPKAVICENVRGLLRPSFNPYFEYIKRELSLPFVKRRKGATWQKHDHALRERLDAKDTDPAETYEVTQHAVNAADYGVPQIRNRVILLAFRADLGVDPDLVKRAVARTHSHAALARTILEGSYWDRHKQAGAKIPKRVIDLVTSRYANEQLSFESGDEELQPWLTLRDAVMGLPKINTSMLDKTTEQGGFPDHIGWPGARIYDGHTPNELDRPAKTVKAGVHGVPGGESVMQLDNLVRDDKTGQLRPEHRYMTVRETARVMTFGDDWSMAGPRGERMRQLGNAVPVKLGEVFTSAVAKALDDAERRS